MMQWATEVEALKASRAALVEAVTAHEKEIKDLARRTDYEIEQRAITTQRLTKVAHAVRLLEEAAACGEEQPKAPEPVVPTVRPQSHDSTGFLAARRSRKKKQRGGG